jgi:hypothetical protein
MESDGNILLQILSDYLINDIITNIIFEYISICNTEKLDRIITIKESCKPHGIAVSNKLIFISDIINHRIMVFDKTSDKLLYTFGQYTRTSRLDNPLLKYEYYIAHNLQMFTLDDVLFNTPTHMIVDNEMLYVVDKFEHRIQMFKIHENNQLSFHGCFGKDYTDSGIVYTPYQILIIADKIYIMSDHRRIIMYDNKDYEREKYILWAGCDLNSMSIDNEFLIISFRHNNEISIYSLDEPRELGYKKKYTEQFYLPGYILLAGNELLVIDQHKNQIQILNKSSLEFIRSIKICNQAISKYITVNNNEIYIPTRTVGKKNEYSIYVFKRFYKN